MSDPKDTLKNMLQDIINDRTEQATATMHDYFVSKTREVSGLGDAAVQEDDLDESDISNTDEE